MQKNITSRPGRSHSLFDGFFIRSLNSLIAKLDTCKVKIGLSLTWSENQDTCLLASRPTIFPNKKNDKENNCNVKQ